MAIFSFRCPEHGEFSKFLPKGTESHPCPKCSVESDRIVKAGGIRVTEKIDNGLMGKAVERLTDIEELNSQRSAIHKEKIKREKLV